MFSVIDNVLLNPFPYVARCPAADSRQSAGLADPLRREVWAVDRNIATTFVGPLEGFLQQCVFAAPRFAFITIL